MAGLTTERPKKKNFQDMLDEFPELESDDYNPSFTSLESESGFDASFESFSISSVDA